MSRAGIATHLRFTRGFAPQCTWLSQRSLQDAPIFRLLLKVAVKGTHQCDFLNFCGSFKAPNTLEQHMCAGTQTLRCWAPCARPRADPPAIASNLTCAHGAWLRMSAAYLLGLLAMIKCSICSYQCDNWYVSNWRLACHIYFSLGRCSLELAQRPLRVAGSGWFLGGF